ncbi:MAG: CPBP family intramembrane metalloprotease [Firmicutes bacterium]|nr:CPBP family intramembrane metalloprotease [Bacillota bacterium]
MVFVTTESIKALRATEHWKKWFGGSSPSFVQYMVRMQLLLILGFFIIFFVLFLIKKNPSKFYFSMGDLNAKVKPVKWLAVQDNIYWKGLGSEFGIYLSIGILIYLLFTNGIPAINDLMQVVRYIPLIIIFAAINSVYEELVYRASLLSVLESVIGERHALSITTLYFGIGHFYGAPIKSRLVCKFLSYQ